MSLFRGLGEIAPGFFALGSGATPVYLLDGPHPVLFEAGFGRLGMVYRQAIEAVLGDRHPEYLLITHSHFDHVGAAGHLKRAFPGMKVAASARAAEILRRPNARALIGALNAEVDSALKGLDPAGLVDEAFIPFEVDLILGEGDEVDLGGHRVRVMATPGHTWDFLSYFIPEKGILVPSESVGCADPTGYVVCDFLVDYDVYMGNLRRQSTLGARVLAQGHHFAYLDDTVADFFRRSEAASIRYRELVLDLLGRTGGDQEAVVASLKALEWDPRPLPKQPEKAYLLNTRARVRFFAEQAGGAHAARV